MQIPGSRARSHAHSRRKGRFALHVVVAACAAAAVLVTYRFPVTTQASMPETVSPTSLTGVTGLAEPRDTAVFRPGTSLDTQASVRQLTLTSDVTSVRPSAAISPLSSFSSGAVAAAVTSGNENIGVTALAEIVDPTKPFQLYTTKPNDTVSSIAAAYNITTGTLLDNNPTVPESAVIQQDQELMVPRVDGIMHKVSFGETVDSIVAQYDNITSGQVLGYRPNALTSASEPLEAGRFVLLPGATRKPPPPPPPPPEPDPVVIPPAVGSSSSGGGGGGGGSTAPAPSGGRFSYPLNRWVGVSDPFGVNRGVGRIHEGIDLDLYGLWSSPIYSSCSGVVSKVEYLTYSYGYHVIVDCGDGWSTLYAHMSVISATPGQIVSQGTQLGLSGVTGFTTGEHLHFEIRYNGAPVNPADYLYFHGYGG